MVTHPVALATSSLVGLALIGGMSATSSAQDSKAALQGVWQTVEVVVPGSPAHTYKPESTLAIFHGRHYTRVEVHSEQPRPALADQAHASADQLREVWGPFVAEAGTFEVSGSNTITMHAMVAKNPAAMTANASSVYTYRREGDFLTLTEVRTPAGPASMAITIKLARVE